MKCTGTFIFESGELRLIFDYTPDDSTLAQVASAKIIIKDPKEE